MNMLISLLKNLSGILPAQSKQKQTSPLSEASQIDDIAATGIDAVRKGSPTRFFSRSRLSGSVEQEEFPVGEAVQSFQREEGEPKVVKTTNKVITCARGKFERIAHGAAKDVWRRVDVTTGKVDPEDTNVYYTPRQVFSEKILHRKEAEIKEEVQTGKLIQEKLDKLGLSHEGLAIDFIELDPGKGISNKYTVITRAAIGDLGQLLRGELSEKGFPPPTFPETVKLVQQLFVGLRNLHLAGFVHGDIKPDNILVYRDKDGYKLKLTDFGKTCQLEKHKSRMGVGNPRIAGEDRSFPAEVFAGAQLAILLLEMEFLEKGDDGNIKEGAMLVPVEKNERATVQPRKDRLGIESFVILNKFCPHSESSLMGKVKVYSQKLGIFLKNKLGIKSSSIDKNTQREIYGYVDKLTQKLAKANKADSPDLPFELRNILGDMLDSDRTARPTMEEVVDRFDNIVF